MPFVLSLVLGLIYKRSKIPDDLKPFIASICGIAIGIAAMFYNEARESINFIKICDYSLAGLIAGSSSTGIYEMFKSGPTAKTYIAVDENNKRIPNARIARISKIKMLK